MMYYIFEFSAILGFSGVLYFLFLARSKAISYRRHYILGSILAALLIPFFPVMQGSETFLIQDLLPQITIGGELASDTARLEEINDAKFPWNSILVLIYILISGFFLSKLGYAFYQLYSIISRANKVVYKGTRVAYSDKVDHPCSFMRTIIIPNEVKYSGEELDTIITHESTHISLGHSLDRVLVALLLVLFWWHPVLWLFKKQLEKIHEFQVDKQMLSIMNTQKYKEILLRICFQAPALSLTNTFNSHLKQRLIMMKTRKMKSPLFKVISLSIVAIAGMLLIHACGAETASDELIETMATAESTDILKSSLDTITTFDMDTKKELTVIKRSEGDVYLKADRMPLFPGCDLAMNEEALTTCSNTNLIQYIYKNIKYPEIAREESIEGMIVVKFVVDESGKIQEHKYLKTLGYGMEIAVDNMLESMNAEIEWIPGQVDNKAVSVEYTLPIKFKLQ